MDADALARARKAAGRYDWRLALRCFRAADAQVPLGAEDLELLAWACAWTGDLDLGIASWERAYADWLAEGRPDRAAVAAFWIAWWHVDKGHRSVAAGWYERLERLSAGQDAASRPQGYAELVRAWDARHRAALDEAVERGGRARELATRAGDRDLWAFSMTHLARVAVLAGDREEGLRLADEAGAAAVGHELSPGAAFVVYCNVVALHFGVADLKRAAEWTQALARWCERQSLVGFPGICRVEHAKVLSLTGQWAAAIAEAERACAELEPFAPGLAGDAFYQLGELRLRTGDLGGAEACFARAHELGTVPQPGRSLLLAAADVGAGLASIRTALQDGSWYPLERARLLPTFAELALAAGEVGAAAEAADELARIAAMYGSSALEATAATARGRVQLARGEVVTGATLAAALRAWQRLGLPYEVAMVRLPLAEACLVRGDRDTARLELQAALRTLIQLGAAPDAGRVRQALDALDPPWPPGARSRRGSKSGSSAGSGSPSTAARSQMEPGAGPVQLGWSSCSRSPTAARCTASRSWRPCGRPWRRRRPRPTCTGRPPRHAAPLALVARSCCGAGGSGCGPTPSSTSMSSGSSGTLARPRLAAIPRTARRWPRRPPPACFPRIRTWTGCRTAGHRSMSCASPSSRAPTAGRRS